MMDTFNFSIEVLPSLMSGFGVSLRLLGASLLIGIPLGFVLAIGSSARSRLIKAISICIVEIGRGAPLLLILQLVYFGLPSVGMTLTSFVSAVLALALVSAAYMSEIIRAGLEAVPFGQKEAASALGLSPSDAMRYIIVPQALRTALPPLLAFSILMLQGTSLAFTIAVPEIVSQASGIASESFRYLESYVLVGLVFALVSIPATIGCLLLERRLSRHR